MVNFAPKTARSGPGLPKEGVTLPRNMPRADPVRERAGTLLAGTILDPHVLDALQDADAPLDDLFDMSPGVRLPPELIPIHDHNRHALVGINAAKIRERETAERTGEGQKLIYGSTEAIFDDLDALGVSFIRQPSSADLGWPRGVAVPVVADGEEMYSSVFGIDNDTRLDLIALFESLVAGTGHTQQVVLTLFSGGTNNFNYEDTSGEYDTSVGVGELNWEWNLAKTEGGGGLGHDFQVIPLWDSTTTYSIGDFLTADDYDTGVTGSYSLSDTGSRDFYWALNTLDLRSPYKLKYIYYIGYAMGRLLQEINDAYWTNHGEEIWDKILGVEIFNQSNKANPFMNYNGFGHYNKLSDAEGVVEAGARFWSLAVREMVRGLQHSFLGVTRLSDATIPVTLPLWLPSLSIYFSTGTTVQQGGGAQPTFETVLRFQQKLCEFLLFDFDVANDTSDNPEAPLRPDFTWFQNQDYHYYQYKDSQSPGLILRLAAEVQALRRTFRGTAYGGRDVHATAGHPVTISVCENGAADNVSNIPAFTYSYVDTTAAPTSAEIERFQAREVWRRLSVAATGARRVAWHTHMSYRSSTSTDIAGFNYLGLREDDLTASGATTTNQVVQRLSYWAYQRFAGLAVDPTIDSPYRGQIVARFANRLPATTDYFQDLSGAGILSDINHVGIAIHFIRGPNEHYYLLMVDPAANHRTWVDATATLYSDDGHQVNFEQIYTIPTAAMYDVLTTPTAVWEFPTQSLLSTWIDVIPGSEAYTGSYVVGGLKPDADPVLVRSYEAVRVAWS